MVIRSRMWSKALAAVIIFALACYAGDVTVALLGAWAGILLDRAVDDFRKWNPRR